MCEPLEHSVRMMTLDDSPMEKMSDDEPLEHSVLDAAMICRRVVGAPVRALLQCSIMLMGLVRGLRTEDGAPPFCPDPEQTLSNGPHATGIVDRISDGPVQLPAVDGGRVAWSSAENSDGCIAAGFQCWNMDGDVEDQYETFNGMPAGLRKVWMFGRTAKWMWLLCIRLYHMPRRMSGIRVIMIH